MSMSAIKFSVFMPAVVFSLLIMGSIPFSANAASGPDGFANVPWGASKSQVDQKMAQQGFMDMGRSKSEMQNGSIGFSYKGELAGFAGTLTFWFMNDAFWAGELFFFNSDGGDMERSAYLRFLPIIESKYGSPTKSGQFNPGGSYDEWKGLQAGSDSIEIRLHYSASQSQCGRSLCSSSFGVNYFNDSLLGRVLAGGHGSGL